MKTYMRGFVFGIALTIVVGAVITITQTKLSKLKLFNAAQDVEVISVKDRERQLKCMADNIYYEAASEPAEGKIAVGQVVMNRVAHPSFPKDPCKVIYERNIVYQVTICQFSWFCDGSTTRNPVNPRLYAESMDAAKIVLLEGFRLPSLKEALFYHADYVNPRWGKTKVAKIGRHIFYKQPEKLNGNA